MTIGEPRRTVDNVVDNLEVLHNHQYARGVGQFRGSAAETPRYVAFRAGGTEAQP